MKNKKVLLFAAALLSGGTLMAQGGDWKLAGNSLTGTEKLGSTNNQDVRFISNNVVNAVLSKTGNWGIGVLPLGPLAKLHVNGAAGQDAFRVQVNGSTRLLLGSNGGLAVGVSSTAPPPNGLFVSGNTGIGTITPITRLHVVNGASGAKPFANTALTLENSTANYLSLLAPNNQESGILFGKPSNNVDGGIIYNSSFFGSKPSSLEFRTNGNIPRMVVTAEGRVGIGTTNPQAMLDLGDPGEKTAIFFAKSGQGTAVTFNKLNTTSTTPTLRVGNSGKADGIETSSSGGNGIFAQTSDNATHDAGFFNGDVATTGTFRNASDEKLKQNIRDFSSAMDILNQLHPKMYQYKKDGNYALMHLPQGDHYGLIAQDVEKVLPTLVKNTKFDPRSTKSDTEGEKASSSNVIDYKGLNYVEFIPIIIKAIQELSKQNEELRKQFNEPKAAASASEQNVKAVSLTDASLQQNIPNPFTNTTSIRYTLPEKFTTAQIIITDKNGRTIKQLDISGAGKGVVNVDAASLSSGTYSYSLIVDGKLIRTKQMVFTR